MLDQPWLTVWEHLSIATAPDGNPGAGRKSGRDYFFSIGIITLNTNGDVQGANGWATITIRNDY